jgi:hypothetical protein
MDSALWGIPDGFQRSGGWPRRLDDDSSRRGAESIGTAALYYFSYALGGPGFSVPMGLFIAGVSIPSAFMKLLPKWVIVLGMCLAAAGD